jgi:RNA polymerase sigma factor (sigma-70 family)
MQQGIVEMRTGKAPDNLDAATPHLTDIEILTLFDRNAELAWRLFIDRYADLIYSSLCHMGFDHDQAMDRFLYICEKLCEQDFRRLKSVRYAGSSGELTPWLRKVIKNLSINWAWSEEGRKRLLKPIRRLPEHEQRVFELYFWRGLSPSAICEHLRLEGGQEIRLTDVLDTLERIISHLSLKKLWRLLSNLARIRGTVSLDEMKEMGTGFEPEDVRATPEQDLIRNEQDEQLSQALASLASRERLAIQLRYEEGMAIKEIAEILHLSEKEAGRLLKMALGRLRHAYK